MSIGCKKGKRNYGLSYGYICYSQKVRGGFLDMIGVEEIMGFLMVTFASHSYGYVYINGLLAK